MANLITTVLLTLLLGALAVNGQEEIPLYKNEVPNSKSVDHIKEKILDSKNGVSRIANATNPALYAYFPEVINLSCHWHEGNVDSQGFPSESIREVSKPRAIDIIF